MSVSESYRTFVLEQLERSTSRIRHRSMFGGVGLYSGERFFALIDDDVLFFKVDDATRPAFMERGMRAWSPFEDGRASQGWYQLPAEILEEPDDLRIWVEQAVLVAARKKAAKPRPRPKAKPKATRGAKAKPKPKATRKKR